MRTYFWSLLDLDNGPLIFRDLRRKCLGAAQVGHHPRGPLQAQNALREQTDQKSVEFLFIHFQGCTVVKVQNSKAKINIHRVRLKHEIYPSFVFDFKRRYLTILNTS